MNEHADAPVVLVADDGTRYSIPAGVTLLGRRPEAHPGQGAVNLVEFPDNTASLADTHAELRYGANILLVLDLESSTGTTVATERGELIAVGTRKSVDVYRGDVIGFGRRWCRVLHGPERDGADPPPTVGSSGPTTESESTAGTTPVVATESTVEPELPREREAERPAWRAPPAPTAIDDIPPAPVLSPITAPPAGAAAQQKKPIPKGKHGRPIRRAKRRQMRARRRAAGRWRPRIAVAAAAIAVVAAGGFVAYRLLVDDGGSSSLPRLPASVAEPAWERTVDGWAGAPVSDGGDIFVASTTTAGTATLYRLDAGEGSEVWSAEIGRGIAIGEAASEDRIFVSLLAEDGSRLLHVVDGDGGVQSWDALPAYDRVALVDDVALLTAPASATTIDLSTGDVRTVEGDGVRLRGALVVVFRDGALYGYRGESLAREFGPVGLPAGARVDIDSEGTIYAADGDAVTVLASDGERLATLTPSLGDIDAVLAAGDDRLVVIVGDGATLVAAEGHDQGEAVVGLAGHPNVVGIDGRTYLLEPRGDGAELVVRSLPDGRALLRAASGEYMPARGHLVVRTESALDAYALPDGALVWSLPIGGASATLVDGALVTTTYDPDSDETSVRVYR